jgi:hypothetical protein
MYFRDFTKIVFKIDAKGNIIETETDKQQTLKDMIEKHGEPMKIMFVVGL